MNDLTKYRGPVKFKKNGTYADIFIVDPDGNEVAVGNTAMINDLIDQRIQNNGDLSYEEVVNTPFTELTVDHNLGKYPGLEFIDSAGTKWFLSVRHVNKNRAIICSANPISGTLTFN